MGINSPTHGVGEQGRRVEAGLPSRTGVPPVFAARTVSGAEAESKAGSGSETQAGAGRTAREASWMKRARLKRITHQSGFCRRYKIFTENEPERDSQALFSFMLRERRTL